MGYLEERRAAKCGIKNTTPEVQKKETKKKGIAPVSKKTAQKKKDYLEKVIPWIKANPICKINFPGCTGKTQGAHHPNGKETLEKLMDLAGCIPACNHCNTAVEQKHAEAVKQGLIGKRNTKTTRYKNTFKK